VIPDHGPLITEWNLDPSDDRRYGDEAFMRP
jgi:hypothetical protein